MNTHVTNDYDEYVFWITVQLQHHLSWYMNKICRTYQLGRDLSSKNATHSIVKTQETENIGGLLE